MKMKKLLIIMMVLTAAAMFSCASAEIEKTDVIGSLDPEPETTKPAEAPKASEAPESTEVPTPAEVLNSAVKPESFEDISLVRAEKKDPLLEEELSADFGMKRAIGSGAAPIAAAPTQSGLKAGFSDDNRQYGYFLKFLEDYQSDVTTIDIDVSERILLSLKDSDGNSISGARVSLSADGKRITGLTHADGSYQINPAEIFQTHDRDRDMLKVEIQGGPLMPAYTNTLIIDRNGERAVNVAAESQRVIPDPIPLDIVFVMDTTGSMGEEIHRLKNTIQIIHMNLTNLSVAAEIRFGMVLYKDAGDEYRTRVIPLTSDIDEFQTALNEVEAAGGGDTPEDLEAALSDLVNTVEWNPAGIKLAYVITDAPPHLDYSSNYDCADALRDARKQGIKIFSIGTGGLDLQGEYNLRQIAQYTSARYIFLTYGAETGESEGGVMGSVSHHTGSNWSADKLESIIIRFTREELSYLSDSPLLDEDPWFEADKLDTEDSEETLSNLFNQALEQMLDYSVIPVTDKNLLAVLPFQFEGEIGADAEYFNEHLVLAAGSNERIKLAERKDMGQLLAEIEFQNTGVTDEGTVTRIGEFLNADILIIGNLFMKDGKYELFLKMLRVGTAEILSVTRAVIDSELGL